MPLVNDPTSSFSEKVRALTWMIIIIALVGFALTGLVLDWFWPKIAAPAVIALLMAFIPLGRQAR